jgi:hypothetical protein
VQTYQTTAFTKAGRSALAAFAAVALLTFMAVPRSHADDERAKCQHRIEKAEARLDDAIRKHGEHSHEADERRHDLAAERQTCWNRYHQWWDGKEQRWHEDQNWDYDHDHDHPQP